MKTALAECMICQKELKINVNSKGETTTKYFKKKNKKNVGIVLILYDNIQLSGFLCRECAIKTLVK